MRLRATLISFLVLALAILLLAACADEDTPATAVQEEQAAAPATSGIQAATDTPSSPGAEETATPQATATITPTPAPSLTPTATRPPTGPVTICMAQEPESLYLYGPGSHAADVVREVIYDGPVDTRQFQVQPVILEKVPSLEDGDATLEPIEVEAGDWVVDVEGNVGRLRPGIVVHPAGCYTPDCAVTLAQNQAQLEETPAAEEGAESAAADEGPQVVTGTITMEQMVVDFTLLPDILWSDGEPLTAADSVFSFDIAQEAMLPPRLRTGLQGVTPARTIDPLPRTASYTALDEYTVRWTGVPGFVDPYYQSNFFTPLPEHQLSEYTPEELLSAEESARLPLGWGPYVLEEWVPGERIVASRNPAYFRAAEGLPYFDEVIFRFDAADPGAYLDMLANGDCDLVTRDALSADYGAYQELEAQGALVLHTVPGTIWEHLDFGINPVPTYDWRPDLFQDARVRQAVAYCVDRQAIADEAMAGLSTVLNGYIPPDHPLYQAAELADYSYDPERGRALLAEAGWRDSNGDGVAEAYGVAGVADASLLTFNYTPAASPMRERIAAVVAEDLRACGFNVLVQDPVPPQLFFANEAESPVFGRQFDLTGFAWLTDARPPCQLFLSSQTPTAFTGWVGQNVTGYENAAYDAACRLAQNSAPGMESYRQAHLEALGIFNQELPVVPLFVHLVPALTHPRLEGLMLDPTEPAESWNIENFGVSGGS